MLAVDDAFTVCRRQREIVHSESHVQQLPQVARAEWTLQAHTAGAPAENSVWGLWSPSPAISSDKFFVKYDPC